MSRSRRFQLRLANLVFLLLFVCVASVLLWLTARYSVSSDWTAGHRNSLSAPSAALVRTLHDPVTITAFAPPDRSARDPIRRLVSEYQAVDPAIRLRFVDPSQHPGAARAAGIDAPGELVVRYQGRQQTVNPVSEQTLTNALAGLGRVGLRQIEFLTGDGERSPKGAGSADLSAWAGQLQGRGLTVRSVNLASGEGLDPQNSVLVIDSPQSRLLPGTAAAVRQFLASGGNLIWLQDPGPLQGLSGLAADLGVHFLPGIVVDPTSQLLTQRADFIAMLHYGHNPVVQGFHLVTVFPLAHGLSLGPSPLHWNANTLLATDPGSWEANRPVPGTARFEAGRDTPGPIVIAATFARAVGSRTQRVVVIGNGSFVSNGFLNEGGNLDFAMNLANWATHADAYVNLPANTPLDAHLLLTGRQQMIIALLFLVVLPALLLAAAVGVWWRRRQAGA